MVLADVGEQVGQVLVGLRGDVEPVVAEQVGSPIEAGVGVAAGVEPGAAGPLKMVQHVGHPGGGGLDETDAQIGEALGDLVGHQIAEGEQRHASARWGRLWLKFRSNTLVISGAPAPVWMQMAMPSRLAASYTGKKYDSASERSPSTPRKNTPTAP